MAEADGNAASLSAPEPDSPWTESFLKAKVISHACLRPDAWSIVDAQESFVECMADEVERKLHLLLFCYSINLFSCLPN